MVWRGDVAILQYLQRTPRAVIYARVLSKEQEKKVFFILAQVKSLQDYAASQGLQATEEYPANDASTSGGWFIGAYSQAPASGGFSASSGFFSCRSL